MIKTFVVRISALDERDQCVAGKVFKFTAESVSKGRQATLKALEVRVSNAITDLLSREGDRGE